MASVVNKVYEYSTVVVADCFALNFVRIQPPRYYGHFFWLAGKNRHTFNCKKNLVNMAILLMWPMFLAQWPKNHLVESF